MKQICESVFSSNPLIDEWKIIKFEIKNRWSVLQNKYRIGFKQQNETYVQLVLIKKLHFIYSAMNFVDYQNWAFETQTVYSYVSV